MSFKVFEIFFLSLIFGFFTQQLSFIYFFLNDALLPSIKPIDSQNKKQIQQTNIQCPFKSVHTMSLFELDYGIWNVGY